MRDLAVDFAATGCANGFAGMAGEGAGGGAASGAAAFADLASDGNKGPAVFQSGQPSRHTSESALTRPSPIHLRMMSPLAGPNCPPEGGRTYQTALGASAIGSANRAAAPVGAAAGAAAGTTVAGRAGTVATAAGIVAETVCTLAPGIASVG